MGYELTQDILKELLHYDSETGIFTWNKRDLKWFAHCKNPSRVMNMWNTKFAGNIAGTIFVNKSGMRYINIGLNIFNKEFKRKAHRLAHIYMTGIDPELQVDHDDHNGLNNKWENIKKCVTNQENAKNQTLRYNSYSGVIGVTYIKDRRRWKASITVNGVIIEQKMFKTKEEAIARREALNKQYGFHQNHGHTDNYKAQRK